MILYDLKCKISLYDFGIEIPIMDDKLKRTLKKLKSHPKLGKEFNGFSCNRIQEKIMPEDLLRVHSREYINKLFSDKLEEEVIRAYELIGSDGSYNRYNPKNAVLPLSALFTSELLKTAGTLQCCKTALEKDFCFYFGGGFHHAQKDYGEGFCILNDIVIAIRNLQENDSISSAWVIDLDAHKGDGTAALTSGDDSITTLSIHMEKGWPLDTEMYADGVLNPSFIPSDIDIPVAVGEEDVYNKKLLEGLNKLDSFPKPQIALVVMGADPYEKDGLPSSSGLKLTLEQMKERDLLVYNFLKERSIPQAVLIAGGYGAECWRVYYQFLEHVLSGILIDGARGD